MRPLLALAFAFLVSVAGDAQDRGAAPALVATPVPLNPQSARHNRNGELRFLGGLQLSSPDRAFGGLSSLRWHQGRLHAVVDHGRWVSFVPVERGDRLVGAEALTIGSLHAADGRPLASESERDAEGLAWDGGGWLVSFEREHRIVRYVALDRPAVASGIDPVALFGPMAEDSGNYGVEALASGGGRLFFCAERLPGSEANCALRDRDGTISRIAIAPPLGMDYHRAFPTDADFAADGTLYILFRSWSGGSDNRGAVVARSPDGAARTLALFAPPYTVDNFEGLAVREERGRTFLYLATDDNFSREQRTLLLKFELVR